eukprot:4999-Heterococcus_DN1.PRE.2
MSHSVPLRLHSMSKQQCRQPAVHVLPTYFFSITLWPIVQLQVTHSEQQASATAVSGTVAVSITVNSVPWTAFTTPVQLTVPLLLQQLNSSSSSSGDAVAAACVYRVVDAVTGTIAWSDRGVVLAAVTAVDAANSSSTAAVATCVTYHLTEFAVDSVSKSSPFNFQPDISSSNGDTLTAHDILSALKLTTQLAYIAAKSMYC